MGGSTVINSLSSRPDMFAAGVSIGGIPQFENIESLVNIPIWLIHGNLDIENHLIAINYFFLKYI